MYIAPGTADQRLRFYRRTETHLDGMSRPVYQFTAERWGRVDDTSQRASVSMSPQAHLEHRTDAVATIADNIAVDPNGLVKWGDALYFVRGVITVRQLRCQQLTLEAISPSEYAVFDLYDGEDVLDGLHLVDGPQAQTFLLLEDGSYVLQESGWRIKLELGAYNGFSSGFSSGFSHGFA
jgi:hypothetical protein